MYLAHKPENEEGSTGEEIVGIPSDGVKTEHEPFSDTRLMFNWCKG